MLSKHSLNKFISAGDIYLLASITDDENVKSENNFGNDINEFNKILQTSIKQLNRLCTIKISK